MTVRARRCWEWNVVPSRQTGIIGSGTGIPGYVRAAGRIHSEGLCHVVKRSANQRRIPQRGTIGAELDYEYISAAREFALKRAGRCGKVRSGRAGDIQVSGTV